MLSKKQIENILSINGINSASPDDEIRSILLSARYKKDEVDTALVILRENTRTKKTRVEALHKVFRTDQALNSSEISKLLGIDIDIPDASSRARNLKQPSKVQYTLIVVLSMVISISAMFIYMYLHDMGVFHQTFSVR